MTQITDSDREAAEAIVAANIEKWGWGPLDEIEDLSEHKLAVDACAAGIAAMSAELDALREDVERSEKHRNDLADRNTSLSIENGALKATIAQLRDRVAKFAEILETVLPYTEAERLREEADVRCGRTYRNPIQKAVNKARALLTQNEVG